MQGTALQACVGGLGAVGIGQKKKKDGAETLVKRLINPFLSLPPQLAHLSFSSHFVPPSLLLHFSDQAWWQTARTWLVQDPESGWCHHCWESLPPFIHAPSGACRIVVWPLQSEKAQADGFYFNVFITSLCKQKEGDKSPCNLHQLRE